jgi:hypothetical protein
VTALPEFRADNWLPDGHYTVSWEVVIERFGGTMGSRRAFLTQRLLALRDALRQHQVSGIMVLNGSFISARREPNDFDVLLIAPADIQSRKDTEPALEELLDAQKSEEKGYSLFYVSEQSPALEIMRGIWDISKEGHTKGVVEVVL